MNKGKKLTNPAAIKVYKCKIHRTGLRKRLLFKINDRVKVGEYKAFTHFFIGCYKFFLHFLFHIYKSLRYPVRKPVINKTYLSKIMNSFY